MAEFAGKYVKEKDENIEEYFKALGVPYIPRKIIVNSSPTLEINVNEAGEYTMTVSTLMKTTVLKFKLGEEYNEIMPGGTLKNTTIKEGNKLITSSTYVEDGTTITRIYEFTGTHCILTYKHDKTGTEGKRYFKRV